VGRDPTFVGSGLQFRRPAIPNGGQSSPNPNPNPSMRVLVGFMGQEPRGMAALRNGGPSEWRADILLFIFTVTGPNFQGHNYR